MNSATNLESSSLIYQQFKYLYEQQGNLTENHIDGLYDESIGFVDPIHSIQGLASLKSYFAKLSVNLLSCQFKFLHELVTADAAHVTWEMVFRHRSLKNGAELRMRGMTYIRFNEKITYHEDSYDLGAMIYENLPGLGHLTRYLKRRLGS